MAIVQIGVYPGKPTWHEGDCYPSICLRLKWARQLRSDASADFSFALVYNLLHILDKTTPYIKILFYKYSIIKKWSREHNPLLRTYTHTYKWSLHMSYNMQIEPLREWVCHFMTSHFPHDCNPKDSASSELRKGVIGAKHYLS